MSIEELEVPTYLKQCNNCEYKEHGYWCFLFDEAPKTKCRQFVLKRSIKEALEISKLGKTYPHLLQE